MQHGHILPTARLSESNFAFPPPALELKLVLSQSWCVPRSVYHLRGMSDGMAKSYHWAYRESGSIKTTKSYELTKTLFAALANASGVFSLDWVECYLMSNEQITRILNCSWTASIRHVGLEGMMQDPSGSHDKLRLGSMILLDSMKKHVAGSMTPTDLTRKWCWI